MSIKLVDYNFVRVADAPSAVEGAGFADSLSGFLGAAPQRPLPSRSGCSRSQVRLLGEPPGKRGGLKANVRDGDRFPERGLAHRSDGEDPFRSAAARINDSAIVIDVETYAERIGARVAFGDELSDEGIGAAPRIAGQPSA
jgi:hypothetical protein